MKEALGLSRYAPPSAVSALRDLGDTLRLRFLRLLRFFAANFPNPFTADHADIADKKLASVLSVSSCKIRPCIPCVP